MFLNKNLSHLPVLGFSKEELKEVIATLSSVVKAFFAET